MRVAHVRAADPDPGVLRDAAQVLRGGGLVAIPTETVYGLAADGTSVNNVLGYPGIFRGALDARAPGISSRMKLAAAWEIAGLTVASELVPDALDRTVHERVAEAVRAAAVAERQPA